MKMISLPTATPAGLLEGGYHYLPFIFESQKTGPDTHIPGFSNRQGVLGSAAESLDSLQDSWFGSSEF